MSGRRTGLPNLIDPLRLCELGAELVGEYPLAQMPRLASLLVKANEGVSVRLAFSIDLAGTHVLSGQLDTEVELVCQRCLEVFVYPLASTFKLVFVTNERRAAEIADDLEPFHVTAEPVSLQSLVEDELLLSVPQVPRHEFAVCPAQRVVQQSENAAEQHNDDRQNPFAGLADLMKRNKE